MVEPTAEKLDAVLAELHDLRDEVARLRQSPAPRTRRPRSSASRSGNRRIARSAVAIAGLVVIGAMAGAAEATVTPTAGQAFVTLAPAHRVVTGHSTAAGKTYSAPVIGGATTVPSDATAVQLQVQVGGNSPGTLSAYPEGDQADGTGQTLTWSAGKSTTGTLASKIGMNGGVTFLNSSSAAATLTVTITGYSSQVTTVDISGSGGSAGQILTNTGSGASWQNPAPVAVTGISPAGGSAGQVITNTGSGVAWEPGASWATNATFTGQVPLTTSPKSLEALPVPPGAYAVHGDVEYHGANDLFQCFLRSPRGQLIDESEAQTDGTIQTGSIALNGLVYGITAPGNISLTCQDATGTGSSLDVSLVIVQVGEVQYGTPN